MEEMSEQARFIKNGGVNNEPTGNIKIDATSGDLANVAWNSC